MHCRRSCCPYTRDAWTDRASDCQSKVIVWFAIWNIVVHTHNHRTRLHNMRCMFTNIITATRKCTSIISKWFLPPSCDGRLNHRLMEGVGLKCDWMISLTYNYSGLCHRLPMVRIAMQYMHNASPSHFHIKVVALQSNINKPYCQIMVAIPLVCELRRNSSFGGHLVLGSNQSRAPPP